MLSVTSSLLLMTALFNAGLAAFILRGGVKVLSNLFLGGYLLALSLWALVLITTQVGDSYALWHNSANAAYFLGLVIAAAFYLFSISFPEEDRPRTVTMIAVVGVVLFSLTIFALNPTFLVQEIVSHPWGNGAILDTTAYLFFAALFVSLYFGGLIRLWAKYFRMEGVTKSRLLIMALGISITGISGLYFNIVLASPFINDFRYVWSGPLFNTAMGALIAYAIFRFHLFNTKVIIAEFLIGLLWIFTLLRTLIASDPTEQFWNGILFLLSLLIGYLLIRSARAEIAAREQIEHLADTLGKANTRLKELDRQKSEFLSIAAHQLRTPLTAIRGYSSLMLYGDYGNLSKDIKEAVNMIFVSSSRMVETVADFLNVSKIEQGELEYRKENVDVGELARQAVDGAVLLAKEHGLELTYEDDGQGPYTIYADDAKIQHVLGNLIDNAIKYTSKGRVSVHVKRNKTHHTAQISVADTGAGIPEDALASLFDKFIRARNAKDINVTGSGLGLYIAREMVRAHDGSIRAHSLGEGKGSIFVVELPLVEEGGSNNSEIAEENAPHKDRTTVRWQH